MQLTYSDFKQGPSLYAPSSKNNYVSSNECYIFFGDMLIDEVTAITFSKRESKIPVYSYNKKNYSRIADGKVMVQGTIVLNYIDPDYMYLALLDQQMKAGTKGKTVVENTIKELYGLYSDEELDKRIKQMNLGLTGKDAKAVALAKLIGQYGQKQFFSTLKKRYWEKTADQLNDSITSLGGIPPITENNFLPPENFYNNLGPVDIVVRFGSPFDNSNKYRIIKEASFMASEMSMAPTSQTQTEIYNFIAKDVI